MPWGLPVQYLNSASTTGQLGICTDFPSHLGNWTLIGLDQGYQPWESGGGAQRLLSCCVFSVRILSLSGLQCSNRCWTLVPGLSRIPPPGAGSRGGGAAHSHPKQVSLRGCGWGWGGCLNQLPAPPLGRHVTAGGGGGVGGAALVTSPPPPVRCALPARLSLPALARARPVSESWPAAPDPVPGSGASSSLLRAGLSGCGSVDFKTPCPSRKLSECRAPPSWARGHPGCALPPTLGNFWEVPCLPWFLPEVA